MKIRADFVTNSSSSCYVTIIFTRKDKKVIEGEFEGDEVGHIMRTLADADEAALATIIHQATNGFELVSLIDSLYADGYNPQGLFHTYAENDNMEGLFGQATPALFATKLDELSKMEIQENLCGDDFGVTSVFVHDFRTGKTTLTREEEYEE